MQSYIGKYKIISTLGKGGMGTVYHALDEAIEREVAIKIIHPHLINHEEKDDFLQRFINEAKTAVRCSHPNIVTILEYGEDQGAPYLVMEYIKGYSLHQYIKAQQPLLIKKTLNIIVQILKALQFAHEKGVIHRDIKPANILLLADNQIKLTDFGIARLATSSITQSGSILGSICYMPPEQALGNEVNQTADLFSVAVIFSQLLLQSVYTDSIEKIKLPLIKGLSNKIKVNFSENYPKQLAPILTKSLQSDPLKRYQTAKEFISALQAACNLKPTQKSQTTGGLVAEFEKKQQAKVKQSKDENIDFYQWDEKLSVGIPSIDRQHKTLISLINKLYIAMKEDTGKYQSQQILNKVVNYAKSHFIYEESLFKRCNYSNASEHIKNHQNITNDLNKLTAQSKATNFNLSDELMIFLKNWLNHHIFIEDMAYSALLIEKKMK